MKVSINVRTIHIPRITFNRLWLAIAAGSRFVNRNYDDYDNRMDRGELTRDEARAEILGDIANYNKHIDDAIFWSGG
jgi:hypothetical protein